MDFWSRRRTKTPTCFMRNEAFWEETSALPLRSPLYLHYLHFHFLAQRKGTPDETSPLVSGTDWQPRTLLWKAPLKRSPPSDTVKLKGQWLYKGRLSAQAQRYSKLPPHNPKLPNHHLTCYLAEIVQKQEHARESTASLPWVYWRVWQYISYSRAHNRQTGELEKL